MHKAMKSIIKGLEKDINQYAHNMESGKETTDKDPERLKNLGLAWLAFKAGCMLEEMKEDGNKEGKGGMGGMLHAMGKQMGGGGHSGMQAMMNAIGLPQIGFTPPENHHIGNVPYGNQGGGSYGEMNNDMEMRRGRSSRTGRYVHRAEMDEGMNDNYDNMNMAGGQGGSSGGQSGGNTGGGRR